MTSLNLLQNNVLNFRADIQNGTEVTFRWSLKTPSLFFTIQNSSVKINVKKRSNNSVAGAFGGVSITSEKSSMYNKLPRNESLYAELLINDSVVSKSPDFTLVPPLSVNFKVSNVSQTTAIIYLTINNFPSGSRAVLKINSSDNNSNLWSSQPLTPPNVNFTLRPSELPLNTNMYASLEFTPATSTQFKSNTFKTLPINPMPICSNNSLTTNVGSVVKKTGQTIPGFSGTFDVYDATNFCPALFQPTGISYTLSYKLPNNGNYDLFFNINNVYQPYFFDVMQGGVGDCTFDAIISELAYKIPNFLKQGIVKDPTMEHTFFIRLHYKTINNPFWVRITALMPLDSVGRSSYDRIYVGAERPVIWSYLYLKAYLCMNNIFSDFMRHDGVGYNVLEAVYDDDCMRALAGTTADSITTISYGSNCSNNTNTSNAKRDFDNIKNLLNSPDFICSCAIESNSIRHLINKSTGCTIDNKYTFTGIADCIPFNYDDEFKDVFCMLYEIKDLSRNKTYIIVGFHSYSLLRITDDDKVIIRNPWGSTPSYPNGLIVMDYDVFAYFFTLSYLKRTDTITPVPPSKDPFLNLFI